MFPTKRLRLAVLVSGGGTNLQALLDRSRAGTLAAEVVVVAGDNPRAFGLQRAEQAGIPWFTIDYSARPGTAEAAPLPAPDWEALVRRQRIYRHRGDPAKTPILLERLQHLVNAEQQLLRRLAPYRPDMVCLAGYMRLLSPYFLDQFNRDGAYRVLNIHPALLPAFPGQHGYRDTFDYGCKWGGVTVHFVDEGEDSGPVIAQAIYPIWPNDDADAVQRRGLSLEYEVYAQVLNWIAGDYVVVDRHSSGPPRVRITDPDYRSILNRWLQLAMNA